MIDYSRMISQRVQDIKPSGIRKFFDILENMTDAISLGVGEPDFQTPWHNRGIAGAGRFRRPAGPETVW